MEQPFLTYVKSQKRLLAIFIPLMLLEFIGFKLLYPKVNFIIDSYSYIDAAAHNLNINIWPVAYAKFLRLVSVFTHSDLVVAIIQFAVIEASILYFYFTIAYFLKPSKPARLIALTLMVVNPAILSISNYILSDSLFTAGTLTWFTLMIWLLLRPRPAQAYGAAVLLAALFMLRYYAIFYPILALPVLLLAKIPVRPKVGSIALTTFLFAGFIWHSSNQYQKLIGRREFSAFSGWQIAENALIMYRKVPADIRSQDQPPKNLMALHRLVLTQLDTFSHLKYRPDTGIQFYYMWNDRSPLRLYMRDRYEHDSTTPYFKRWASVSDDFRRYGSFLVKRHPWDYIKYYMTMGLYWYIVPTDEALKQYNNGRDSVTAEVKDWFDYDSRRVKSASKNIYTLSYFPIVTACLSSLSVICLIGFFAFGFYKNTSTNLIKTGLLFASYWLLNLAFSSISAPQMLRYQLPTMLLSIGIGAVVLDAIYQSEKKASAASKAQRENNKQAVLDPAY